jgi:hypothetical protein
MGQGKSTLTVPAYISLGIFVKRKRTRQGPAPGSDYDCVAVHRPNLEAEIDL